VAGIITSKTRARYSQRDRAERLADEKRRVSDQHGVQAIGKPFGGVTEEQVIRQIDSSSETRDRMQETRERNQEAAAKKQRAIRCDQEARADEITRRKTEQLKREGRL